MAQSICENAVFTIECNDREESNNEGVSEAVRLMSVGLCCSLMHKKSLMKKKIMSSFFLIS